MSYILDALRKSEQERQIAAGRGAGMLYPIRVDNTRSPALKPLVLAVVIGLGAAAAALWWLWPASPMGALDLAKREKTIAAPPAVAAPFALAPREAPAAASAIGEPRSPPPREPIAGARMEAKPVAAPVPKKRSAPIGADDPGAAAARQTQAPAALRNDRPADRREGTKAPTPTGLSDALPAGVPTLTVSGYINDQDGGRLAIVNDQLLHEGDEVSPGLRLEKIIDDSAVFNYKGQRFRR